MSQILRLALFSVSAALAAGGADARADGCAPKSETRLAVACGNGWRADSKGRDADSDEPGDTNQSAELRAMLSGGPAAASPESAIEGDRKRLEALSGAELYITDAGQFNPWAPGADARSARRQIMNAQNCPKVSILSVNSADRMAQVQCAGSSGAAAPMWINMNELECSPDHVRPLAPPTTGTACPHQVPSEPLERAVASAGADSPTDAAGAEIVDRAEKIARQAQKAIQSDDELLHSQYSHDTTKDAELYDRIKRARDRLKKLFAIAAKTYGVDCLQDGPSVQGQRTCRLLRASYLLSERYMTLADIGIRRAQIELDSKEARTNPAARQFFQSAIDDRGGLNGVGGEQIRGALSEKFGTPMALSNEAGSGGIRSANGSAYGDNQIGSDVPVLTNEGLFALGQATDRAQRQSGDIASEYESLAFRQVLLMGLPESDQKRLTAGGCDDTQGLKFVRESSELGPRFPELHNGYVFGGKTKCESSGAAELDCSHFLARVLGGTDAGAPTTKSLRDAAMCLDSERRGNTCSKASGLAKCFTLVDLSAEHPKPGDIVISRNDSVEKGGHVVVVKGYDNTSGDITTIEAAGGHSSTFESLRRPLYEPSCGGGAVTPRVPRPDLWALRYNDSCQTE